MVVRDPYRVDAVKEDGPWQGASWPPPWEVRRMESLRWWLLLIAAVMFSMSGCASSQDWAFWRAHPTHFASGEHLTFSVRSDADYHYGNGHGNGNGPGDALTDQEVALAQDEGWWGHLMPPAQPADLSGRWVGTWKGLGLFDSLRQSTAEATLVQEGPIGVAHLVLGDTIAAGVPWMMRQEGSRGVRLVYRVSGADAWMRHRAAPSEMTAVFTLVEDKLVGTLPNTDAPIVITLSRAK
jgi:hypothetical protein